MEVLRRLRLSLSRTLSQSLARMADVSRVWGGVGYRQARMAPELTHQYEQKLWEHDITDCIRDTMEEVYKNQAPPLTEHHARLQVPCSDLVLMRIRVPLTRL